MTDTESTQQVHLPPDAAGWRLDKALAAAFPDMSRERLKALVLAGHVAINGAVEQQPARKMTGGETVAVAVPAPTAADARPQDIPLDIVFEDEHLLVVDKPAGLVVHPAAGNFDGTMVNALLHHCAGRLSGIGGVARPGIVHRIDKDTSGLLVVAKTDRAHEGLARQFAEHSIERVYRAIVAGRPVPPAATIDKWLARSPHDRKKIAIMADGRGKRAVTRYRTVTPLNDAALVECRLETGRTHQIRVHMAAIGHPLLGDPVYGRSRPKHSLVLAKLNFHRQALHAAVLGFNHPITDIKLSFASPDPADLQELFSALAV
jgi:23S rRNA pseudouridine1911/1915/1917 synthase